MIFGKNVLMEQTVGQGLFISAEEKSAFTEFKRTRKEAEIFLTLKKLIADASRRETDKSALKKICEFAKKNSLSAVLVSPVNVSAAKKLLTGSGVRIVCIVGGNGETLSAVKKYETKRAVRAGADEVRLVPYYSALAGGNLGYLKREVKKVRKAAKGCGVALSLEDRMLSEDDVALGVRAACDGGAASVCVGGETPLLLRAIEAGAGKITVDCSDVENAEQLRSLQTLGALRLVSRCPEKVAEELLSSLTEL